MSRFLPKPRGLWAVDKAFPAGVSNTKLTPVIVSLIGDVEPPPGCIVVYADPGKAYDWSGLHCLYVAVAVRKGTDATAAVKGLFDIVRPYLTLWEPDTGNTASVTEILPRLKLWNHSAAETARLIEAGVFA